MKNKLFILIAIAASAGLIMAWGCGGKALEGPGEGWTGETTPVTIQAGAGTGSASVSVTKDFGGEARADSDSGGIDSTSGSLTMTCDIMFGPYLVDGATLELTDTPIVKLTVARGHGAIDCADNPPCNVNKYIACWVEKQASGTWCTAYCEGMIPKKMEYEGDLIGVGLHFWTTITGVTTTLDPEGVLFRQDGRRTNEFGMPAWFEMDPGATIVGVGSWPGIDDIAEDGSSNYTFVECNGVGGVMEMSSVDPFDLTPGMDNDPNEDDLDLASEDIRHWRKNFTVSSIGDGSCIMRTIVMGTLPLVGVMTDSVDLARDPIILASKWCDEIDDCTGFTGTWDISTLLLVDYIDNPVSLVGGSTGVDITWLEGTFPELMDASYITTSMMIGGPAPNITLAPTSYFPGQDTYEPAVAADASPAATAYRVVNTKSSPYIYQYQEFEHTLANVPNIDLTKLPNKPLVTTFTSACALGDTFYNELTLPNCFFDAYTITNDTLVPTHTYAQAAAIDFVDYVVDATPTNKVTIDDSGLTASSRHVLAFTKDNVSNHGELPDDVTSSSASVILDNIINVSDYVVDSIWDRDGFLLRIVDAATNNGVFLGIQPFDDGAGVKVNCVVFELVNNAVEAGARMPCDDMLAAPLQLSLTRVYDPMNGWSFTAMASEPGNFLKSYDIMTAPTSVAYDPAKPKQISDPYFTNYEASLVVVSSSAGDKDMSYDIDELRLQGYTHATQMEEAFGFGGGGNHTIPK